jgi:hypothetical protein
VRIFVNQIDAALQVPVQTVHEYKGHYFCLVANGPDATRYETREITMGASNDKTLTVDSGLEEGEYVVMNPRRYLDLMQIPDIPDPPKVELSEAEKKIAAEAKNAESKAGPVGGGRGGPGGMGGMTADSMAEQQMQRYDSNSDGKLSQDEINAMDDRAKGSAQQADTNGDGEVDLAELTKRMEVVVKMIQERMSQGGGPPGAGGPPGGGGGPPGGGRPGGGGGRGRQQ